MSVSGVVDAVSKKPHKNPEKASQGFQSIGILISGKWYTVVTKYAFTATKGSEVSFDLLKGFDNLVDSKTFTETAQGERRSSDRRSGSTTPQGNSSEAIRRLIDQFKSISEDIKEIKGRLADLEQVTRLSSSVKSTESSKKSNLVQNDPFNDELEF